MKQNHVYNREWNEITDAPVLRQTRFTAAFLIFFSIALSLSMIACKKEKKDPVKDDLPLFGTCKPVTIQGHLSMTTDSTYTFTTNGGGRIVIGMNAYGLAAGVYITHNSYPGFRLELWGSSSLNSNPVSSVSHESLNGKHIKDRVGKRRTIIFPDGAKLTIITEGEADPVLSISIYDGVESHHINKTCKSLEYSSASGPYVQRLDDREADGETGAIEFVNSGNAISGLLFVNLYSEETPGNKVMNRVKLGELILNQPNVVNDFYDDPRLGHT